MVEERRKFVRLDARVVVKYRVLERNRASKESESRDIGGGGIRLYLSERMSEGTPLELEMKIPAEPRPILAEGRVVWSKEVGPPAGEGGVQWFDAGIMFTKIDPLDRGRILKYVYNRIY